MDEPGPTLGCLAAGDADDARLAALARALDLPWVAHHGNADPAAFSHWLCFNNGRLCIVRNAPRAPAPTCVDFDAPALRHRLATSGRSQGIALAVGVKKLGAPFVLDATAGLGRDAFTLAALGCRVLLLERSPIVHALLEDGFRRGRASAGASAEILQRMELQRDDARARLRSVAAGEGERPDVVYLDPMFPPRGNSAKVKKDISVLQQLLGVDSDFDELLHLARRAAHHRVVVKRPGSETRRADPAPNFQVKGKASHFDVYLPMPQV